MDSEYVGTDAFRGATFREVDLTGSTFRDCDLTQVKIVSSQVDDVRIDGFDGRAGKVTIDGVEVTEFVNAELDRRYPERVQVRAAATADDYRAAWDLLERLWSDTIARAHSLPKEAGQERVDGEWSFVETLRHLIFGVDIWIRVMVLSEQMPFHPLGLPPGGFPAAEAGRLGIDLGAEPSVDDVVVEHSARAAQVREVLATVTDEQLKEIRSAVLPVWGEEAHSVADCLGVVLNEHCEHHRFAVRDLTLIEDR
ncbi:MAG: DinB family protein [Mycobacteriales bacterium]